VALVRLPSSGIAASDGSVRLQLSQ